MAKFSAEEKAEAWASIFRRNGGRGAWTSLYADLPEAVRVGLDRTLGAAAGEVPVISSYMNEGRWLVLTTSRLVWMADGIQSIDLKSLTAARLDLEGMTRRGPRKAQADEFDITTRDGRSHAAPVEPGPPLFGVLRVLRFIATRNLQGLD